MDDRAERVNVDCEEKVLEKKLTEGKFAYFIAQEAITDFKKTLDSDTISFTLISHQLLNVQFQHTLVSHHMINFKKKEQGNKCKRWFLFFWSEALKKHCISNLHLNPHFSWYFVG